MYPADRTLNRQIQQALYMLKRQYGGTIDIYTNGGSATDVRTGVKTVTKTITRVLRAIVLPVKINRDVVRSISAISANKEFVMGGGYDTGTREFIVDRRDTPNLPTLNEDDWLIYRKRKYQIKTFEEFEFEAGWVITAKELVGEVPEQIYLLSADVLLDLHADVDCDGDLTDRIQYVSAEVLLDLQTEVETSP
jgi:hypothetical protein